MLTYVNRLLDKLLHYTNHMSPGEWFLVLAVVVVLGLVCLRGFGSRTSY